MGGPKVILFSSVFGFILSFLIGIFSGIAFGIILLRALLFAVLFGILAFCADIVFKKFLSEGIDLDSIAESSIPREKGTMIDISVGDEPLMDDGSQLDFYVNSESKDVSKTGSANSYTTETRQDSSVYKDFTAEDENTSSITKESVVAPKNTEAASIASPNTSGSDGFRPVALGKPIEANENISSADGLDVLPDIGDLVLNVGVESNTQNMVLENTDFALEGSDGTPNSKAGTGVMDTGTIASAIRTVLSKDS